MKAYPVGAVVDGFRDNEVGAASHHAWWLCEPATGLELWSFEPQNA